MRISLVTPSYNQAAFLTQCIDSVVGQRYPDLEYLVLDGGSTDGSAEILRKRAAELSYWRSSPDQGQAAAIREGFERATGEILGWLNSDDFLEPGALQAVCDQEVARSIARHGLARGGPAVLVAKRWLARGYRFARDPRCIVSAVESRLRW